MKYQFLFGSLVVGLLVSLIGCGGEAKKPTDSPAAAPAVTSQPEPSDNKFEEALAELSPEDRAAAEKQKVCPVSGGPLGSMGKPYKVSINGRTVFLCCDGCEEELRAHPKKYLK